MRAYVATRKGLLVTDPKVIELSKAQLLFEYFAESRAENNERKFQSDLFRQTLISILGLDIKERVMAVKEGRDVAPDNFIPLILLAGNHHLLKPHLEELKGESGDIEPTSSVNDDEYEKQAARLMADMEPIEGDITAGMSAQDIINSMQAKHLGIKMVDEFPLPPDAIIIGDE